MLHLAFAYGLPEKLVAKIIESGGNPKIKDIEGRDCYYYAIEHDNYHLLSLISNEDLNEFYVKLAVNKGSWKCVEYFIDLDASFQEVVNAQQVISGLS